MLTYPEFDPVALALGPLKVRWYGLMYVTGFLAAWWLALLSKELYLPLPLYAAVLLAGRRQRWLAALALAATFALVYLPLRGLALGQLIGGYGDGAYGVMASAANVARGWTRFAESVVWGVRQPRVNAVALVISHGLLALSLVLVWRRRGWRGALGYLLLLGACLVVVAPILEIRLIRFYRLAVFIPVVASTIGKRLA
jgi:hypothetical protein